MKKVVLGALMFLAGLLSSAVLLAGGMAKSWTINGEYSAMWNISQYGITSVLYCFIVIAVIGLIIAVWGSFEKK